MRNEMDDIRMPSETFQQGLNRFTVKTASSALAGENRMYSPASLYLAMAMTAGTAGGKTREELLSFLEAESPEILEKETSSWLDFLEHSREDGPELNGSLWLNEDIPCHKETLERITKSYGAAGIQCDFSSEILPEKILKWVHEATHGLLGKSGDFSPRPDTAFFLLSALYYKGAWNHPFSKTRTETGTFFLNDGNRTDADFMQETIECDWMEQPEFTAAALPIQNGGEMILILPGEGLEPADLTADPAVLKKVLFPEERETVRVSFRIPKFHQKLSREDLPEILRELGVTGAFGAGADFSPLTPKPLFLSEIRQDLSMSIDETGCEGAAFTQVTACLTCFRPPEKTAALCLNRPFLYAVRYGETVLFVGTVYNPR